jgi:hypothetical protein
MAVVYVLAIFGMAVALAFKVSVAMAFYFFAASMISCVAAAGFKWGLLRGDKQQRIGVPIVAILLLGFAYWLSLGVSVAIFGLHLSGLLCCLIGAAVGLLGVPLATAES